MSGYYNRFKDGPSDKPKKKKPSRTKHATWGEIIRGTSPGAQKAKKLKQKSPKAIKANY